MLVTPANLVSRPAWSILCLCLKRAVIIARVSCMPSFYTGAGHQTPVLMLVRQVLYSLSHLPGLTNLFTSTDLRIKELAF